MGRPRVDEVIYYVLFLMSWMFELLVAFFAVLLFLVVPIYGCMYYAKRKPATLRVMISLVVLKLVWVIF
jgi:hypothetical protein